MSLKKPFAMSLATALFAITTACASNRSAPVPPPPGPDFAETETAQPAAPLAASDGERPISPEDQLFFGFDSDKLDSDGHALLAEVAVWVKDDPSREIVVQGHTDSAGASDYNLDLSARRARAAAAQLHALGVPARQIVIVALGENDAALTPTQVNRRVVIFASTDSSVSAAQ